MAGVTLRFDAADPRGGMTIQEIEDAVAKIRAAGFATVEEVGEPKIRVRANFTAGIKTITAEGITV